MYQEIMKERKAQIESEFSKIKSQLPDGDFKDIFMYPIEAGGKRVRPIILLETVKMLGGNLEEAMYFALALEMIHTYSLVHDDLPCMDDDELRRGKPTTHVIYGEGNAVLVGDALLNYAPELMIKGVKTMREPLHGIEAMETIMNASGVHGMILGQVYDIENENKSLAIEAVRKINALKTSQLIEAAFVAGGHLAVCSAKDIETLRSIGRHLGISFQIQDDILDVTSDVEHLGKPIGSDKKNMKRTYVDILGIDACKSEVMQRTEEAKKLLGSLNGDSAFLEALFDYLASRIS